MIQNRRSIFPKMYTGVAVPKEVINKMLENANWAPTHKFTEPWRFQVFTGAGIQRLAVFQSDLYRKRTEALGIYEEAKYLKLLEKPHLASHIIAVIMQRDIDKRVPVMEEEAAVSCAVQNMYLTATAYGAGCYWSTGGPTFWDDAKPFFKIGKEDKLMGFVFVGMPKESLKLKGHRGAWEEKVVWVEA